MAEEKTPLEELLEDELKDLYSAENQIIKALPKMIKACESPELKRAFERHLEETRRQVDRLDQIGEELEVKLTGKKCKGMEGLIEENKELMGEDADPDVMDAGLIVGSQKIEHYEIAGYGSAVTFAKLLGNDQAARLLAQTLDEEERTDKKLSEIAESAINVEAANGGNGAARSKSRSKRR